MTSTSDDWVIMFIISYKFYLYRCTQVSIIMKWLMQWPVYNHEWIFYWLAEILGKTYIY